MSSMMTLSDNAVTTLRNFVTGGLGKSYSAKETDVSGGETGTVVDVIVA